MHIPKMEVSASSQDGGTALWHHEVAHQTPVCVQESVASTCEVFKSMRSTIGHCYHRDRNMPGALATAELGDEQQRAPLLSTAVVRACQS